MAAEDSTAQLDLFRRRRELKQALATVEAAIAQQRGETPETAKLQGLRVDLLAALELTELLLERL
jgi:hypothetical protein